MIDKKHMIQMLYEQDALIRDLERRLKNIESEIKLAGKKQYITFHVSIGCEWNPIPGFEPNKFPSGGETKYIDIEFDYQIGQGDNYDQAVKALREVIDRDYEGKDFAIWYWWWKKDGKKTDTDTRIFRVEIDHDH